MKKTYDLPVETLQALDKLAWKPEYKHNKSHCIACLIHEKAGLEPPAERPRSTWPRKSDPGFEQFHADRKRKFYEGEKKRIEAWEQQKAQRAAWLDSIKLKPEVQAQPTVQPILPVKETIIQPQAIPQAVEQPKPVQQVQPQGFKVYGIDSLGLQSKPQPVVRLSSSLEGIQGLQYKPMSEEERQAWLKKQLSQ